MTYPYRHLYSNPDRFGVLLEISPRCFFTPKGYLSSNQKTAALNSVVNRQILEKRWCLRGSKDSKINWKDSNKYLIKKYFFPFRDSLSFSNLLILGIHINLNFLFRLWIPPAIIQEITIHAHIPTHRRQRLSQGLPSPSHLDTSKSEGD